MSQPLGATDRPIRRRFAADGRVRSGCLTCKARKKKCDGQASGLDGRCRSCIRLGLVCEQLPLRRVPVRAPRRKARGGEEITGSPKDENKSASQAASSSTDGDDDGDKAAQGTEILPRSRSSVPDNSGSWEGIERVLLRYFLDHVAPLCSILQQDGSSFCSVLLPMAIVDPSLLHALFAYASVHVDTATSAIPVTPEARIKFENQVTRGLAEAIKNNTVTESTIACALVISTTEVIGGDTSRWLLHLQGAGHLIKHLGTSRLLRTSDGAFLLRYFAYHDIMASLSTGHRASVNGVYWVQDVNTTVTSADSFMGLGHHIFRHMTEISAFIADTADLDLSSCSDRRSRETLRAEDMAQALRSQDLRLQVDSADSHIQALIHHAEAFRFASLFYLYRHLLRFGDAGAVYKLRMEDCVRQILHYVSQVPSNMFCEIGLLFPLFMAGIGSSDNASMIQYIQDRLTCIETWTKFKHVGRARELLQLLWDKGRTDWELMLRELDWNLSFA
ncbi:fungal-specific transcription factor domain-containing protein [Penicillium riverlandense]|uniref:fungal-specific transcription factor domain-containing protein n=1 Tax=Penicillium riverlandense TaxID=1903569 RepID=UPI0025475C65|nr:fungal-specific transcription factor domain-containing protein [Penicillium riverlandense]KAJ5807964.1 fungal-specific transcription factor domain-containing protein [Penicillium riverlandense]